MLSAVHRRTAPVWGRLATRACAAFLLALGGPSCTRDVGLLNMTDAGTTADRPAVDQNVPSDAGAGGGGGSAATNSLCASGRVHFPDASGTCAGTLAARSHRYALCSCGDWSPGADVYTDASSSNPAITAGPVPAAVGVNGKLAASADLSIRGSVYASGAAGISANGRLDVGKTLRSAGPVTVTAPGVATVVGDAFIGGDTMGSLRVSGTLHLAPSATMGLATTAPTTTREVVSVPDPCDCTAPFDVGAIIAATATVNDNAAKGLDPNRLITPGGSVSLDIGCGTYFLNSIDSAAPVNLNIHGRALLAIAGGVTLSGGMTIIFDPGAELDLLIGGAVTSYGPYPVGAYTAAALRIWIAGAAPLTFNGHPVIGGIFEAPLSNVSAPSGMEVYGSILASSFAFGDLVLVHYDQAVLSSGLPCGDPPLDPVP